MKPAMLATDISKAGFNTKPEFYLNSNEWGLQQKVDGVRMMVDGTSSKVICYNRNGEKVNTPECLLNYRMDEYITDGEYLDGKFYPFDLVANGTFLARYNHLNLIASNPLPLFLGTEAKTRAFDNSVLAGTEGVIFRKLTGLYKHGRSKLVVKCKFTSDVDCVVLERPDPKDTNDNFYLGMWDGEKFAEVGKVSALTGDGPSVKIGDVVKVTCLYVSNSGKLYQPVKPRIRTDKRASDCTIDQLDTLRTSKEIIV